MSATDLPSDPAVRACLLPSRVWRHLLTRDPWSAEECAHLAACSACRARLARALEAANPRPVEAVAYSSLDPSTRRTVDVSVIRAVLEVVPVEDIVARAFAEHSVRITPEQVREIPKRAREDGEFVYMADDDQRLEKQLVASFHLRSARVVRSTGVEPIVRRAADLVRGLIWDIRRGRLAVGTPPQVLVGIAGGPTNFNVMSHCGHLLEHDGFDGQVIVDAMLPGAFWLHMGYNRPHWPRFQLRNYWEGTRHLKETNHGGQYIPPMVTRADFHRLLTNDQSIQETVRSALDLDIIVTSGALWDDPHGASQIKLSYPDPEELRQRFGIVGELFWHPLAADGPVLMDPVPMTALGPEGLARLADLIRKGKRVVAVLGPCFNCNKRKTALVECLLRLKEPIITDLVVDAVTAEKVINNLSDSPSGVRRSS